VLPKHTELVETRRAASALVEVDGAGSDEGVLNHRKLLKEVLVPVDTAGGAALSIVRPWQRLLGAGLLG
jgi:hypothetical protein